MFAFWENHAFVNCSSNMVRVNFHTTKTHGFSPLEGFFDSSISPDMFLRNRLCICFSSIFLSFNPGLALGLAWAVLLSAMIVWANGIALQWIAKKTWSVILSKCGNYVWMPPSYDLKLTKKLKYNLFKWEYHTLTNSTFQFLHEVKNEVASRSSCVLKILKFKMHVFVRAITMSVQDVFWTEIKK